MTAVQKAEANFKGVTDEVHSVADTPSPAQAARKISGSGFEFLSWEASAQKVKNSRSSSAAKIVGAFRETLDALH